MIAFITGITGQDGSILAELLMSKGYIVHGLIRRSSSFNTQRINHIYCDPHNDPKLILHYGDLTDGSSLLRILSEVQPDEVYHLGAMSHVRVSFDCSEYTANVTGLGTLRLFEAIRTLKLKCRIYNAASSEMFGSSPPPQNELTPFCPCSPYACAKIFSYHTTKLFREAYGLHASNGILFNHESPRRGETFVTKKIVKAAAQIYKGKQKYLYLGNLDARRDWGYANDYIQAMWLMLQQDVADDYVIATGETHSVKDFCEAAFSCVNLDWKQFVKIDERYYRPSEVDVLLGDSTKAKEKLKWAPSKTFKELVNLMMEYELNA